MGRAGTIASAANPLVKDVRRAIARGGLTDAGLCVAESFHLLEEALGSRCAVEQVLAAESARAAAEEHLRHTDAPLAVLPDALFRSLSSTENSQGVMALVRPREWRMEQLFQGCPLVVVLDGLQDPGNAGTIVRAAEAFGATGVVFGKGTVSAYNPKALRASAGSLFRVPFVASDAAATRRVMEKHGVEWYATVPTGAGMGDLAHPCALIVGNEARGVGAEWREGAREIAIPTAGVESLNAALAAGILLYEARRQRGTGR